MPKLETRNSKLVTTNSVELTRVGDFKDLLVWKLARPLRIQVYELPKKLPVDERFALWSQLRRAVQSIDASVTEGFGRYSFQENIPFSCQARGSAYEVRDHLVTASHAGFIGEQQFTEADELTQRVIQFLNGDIRATSRRQVQSKAKSAG